jgi:hypothetical protein
VKTTYVVALTDGTSIDVLSLSAARQLVHDHPGSECRPVVRFGPCRTHRSYEADNCPRCAPLDSPRA